MSIGIRISSLCLITLFAVTGLRAGNPAALADVVGNPGGSGGLSGHDGLYNNADGKVTSVGGIKVGNTGINHTNIVQATLANYKKNGYWGAKYDNRTTAAQKLAVWRSLYHQCDYHAGYSLVIWSLRHRMVFNPSKEIVLEWTGVSLAKQNQTGWSVERCDFGVAAAYYEGTGRYYGPAWYDWGWTPSVIFDKFPNSRS